MEELGAGYATSEFRLKRNMFARRAASHTEPPASASGPGRENYAPHPRRFRETAGRPLRARVSRQGAFPHAAGAWMSEIYRVPGKFRL